MQRLRNLCRSFCKYEHILHNYASRTNPRILQIAHLSQVATEVRQNNVHSIEQFSSLAKTEADLKKIHLILLEYENTKEIMGRVPELLLPAHVEHLLTLHSPASRQKYFNYLFKTEMSIKAVQRRKERKREENAQKKLQRMQEAADHIQYGIQNTMFLFIRDQNMHRFYNWRQVSAFQFGQKIVFDMSYENEMRPRDLVNCGEQLQAAYADNRVHVDPFHLHFCNLQPGSGYEDSLKNKALQSLYESSCMVTATPQSYLDLFPREKLVYLTPNARERLKEWDHDAVYVVGALVDKSCQKPVSFAKAKREGLKMARLPFEEHLEWGTSASKALPLNILLRILLEMKATNDWKQAFRHIPKRKVVKFF